MGQSTAPIFMTESLTFYPDNSRGTVASWTLPVRKGAAMIHTRFVGALIALVASAVVAQAQIYPSHPLTMMVGFPPGGPTDTLARILAGR